MTDGDDYIKELENAVVDFAVAMNRIGEEFSLTQPGIALFIKHKDVLTHLLDRILAEGERIKKLKADGVSAGNPEVVKGDDRQEGCCYGSCTCGYCCYYGG